MSKECYFSYSSELDTLLNDSFDTTNTLQKNSTYLVSNQPTNTELFAPEINYYINNSTDDLTNLVENIRKLYASRIDEFDFSKETSRKKQIGKSILIISKKTEQPLQEHLQKSGFSTFQITPSDIKSFKGEIGEFYISTHIEHSVGEHFDQVIWSDIPAQFSSLKGTYELRDDNEHEVVQKILSTPDCIDVTSKIFFQRAICLQNNCRTNICNKCIETCEHGAIQVSHESTDIRVLQSSCIGCGKCISVCPTGALDAVWMTRGAFPQLFSHYANKSVLIIPEAIDLSKLTTPLPIGVLPFIVKDEDMLDENHLLTILQTTARPIFIYTESVNTKLESIIQFIHNISHKIIQRDIIFVAHSKEELAMQMETQNVPIEEFHYLFSTLLGKRYDTSARLTHLVGNKDLGTIRTNHLPPFGTVTVNTEQCTLCLACADACKTKAITAHPEDNSLRFTASLCVQCGYCLMTCPEENCLGLIPNQFLLAPTSFTPQILAEDSLFNCSDCGKEFAPKKSIEKIVNNMAPHFANDPIKLKTLTCCPDCKRRIMIEQQIFNLQPQGL